mgnify:CR=1 FL=1
MARDPRADILEDDLFPKPTRKIHRVHAQQSGDGTIHFDLKKGIFGTNSRQPTQIHKGNIWHFSKEEKEHLLLATAAFTIALGIAMATGIGGLLSVDFSNDLGITVALFLLSMPVMLFAVGPAFILHEIGHKIVAKKYGCWAEFRADPSGLKMGIMIVALTGILFMAPGAVMVAGLVTRRQNGHIAIAGPLVNFTLFGLGIIFGGVVLGIAGAEGYATNQLGFISDGAINLKAMVGGVVYWWIFANLGLGLFNLIPYGPLDGAKVKDWNPTVWFCTFAVFVSLAALWMTGTFSPVGLAINIAELF